MRYGDPPCAHGASTRYAPRSRIRLPLPTFGGPALRAVYSRKVWPLCFASHSFAIPSGPPPRCRSQGKGNKKKGFFVNGRKKGGLVRIPLTKVLLKKGNQKFPRRPPPLWAAVLVFFW